MSVHRGGGQVPQIVEGTCSMWAGKAGGWESQVGWECRPAGITGGLESQAGWKHRWAGSAGRLE
jgi:hypothetical protein